jgi:hypothetical protein
VARVYEQGDAGRRRSRAGRALRLLMLLLLPLLLLVIVVVAAVQFVLWSDLPRATIVRELQAETGLRIEAATSRTRWDGSTELRDVSIALPLEDQPFVRVPVMRVRHTRPLLTPLGVEIYEANLESPWVLLERDELGRWNAMRAVEIVQARQAQRPTTGDTSPLPRITVHDGSVEVAGDDGQRTTVPLEFAGEPDGPVSWAFRLTAGEVGAARGRLAPHGEWQHQVELSFGDDQSLLESLAPADLLPLRGAIRWQGGLQNGAVSGRLHVQRLQAGDLRAEGEAAVSAINGRVVLRPRNLDISSVERREVTARLVSGVLTLEESTAVLQRLRVEGGGAAAEFSGRWDLEQESGEITATWAGAAAGPISGHEGQIRISAEFPARGAASVRAHVRSTGLTAQGAWDVAVQVGLRGATWEQMVGDVTVERLVWRDEQGPIDLSGASARLETDWPLVRLSRAAIPGAERSSIQAWVDVPASTWWVEGEAVQWDIPRVRGGVLNLLVRGEGTATRATVSEMRIAGAGFEARVSGEYDLNQDEPLQATARISYEEPVQTTSGTETTSLAVGSWLANTELRGRLQPLNLRMVGEVQGREIRIGDAHVDQVVVPLTGRATEDRAQFASGQFDLLGAAWSLQGSYVDAGRMLALQVTGESIPLQQVARMFEIPIELPGQGEARVQVLVPGLDLDALQIQGEFAVADIDRPGLRVERGRGEIVTRGGVLTLRGLELVSGEAQLTGMLEYNLRKREDLRVDVQTRGWPIGYEGVPLAGVVDGRAQVALNLEKMTFSGVVDAAADVTHDGMSIGRITTLTNLEGRRFDVQRIAGDLCAGTIDGRARIVLDDLLQTRAEITLDGIDLQQVSMCFGADDDYTGRLSATLSVGPAADARAPEPLALVLRVTSDGGAYRTISFGGAEINAFFGPRRTVIDRSNIALADGTMTLFSRVSRHEGARFVHVQTNLERIDIDQFYRAFAPDEGPLPGRLSGSAAFGGYVEAPHRMFGEARLSLVDSDLANLPAIAAVYNLLNLRFGGQEPRGRGDVRVRLEGNALEITRLRYFNRGADIAGSLRVDNVWLGGESPISGVAAGSVRPLRDLDIPLLDIDRMLSTLQTSAASVEVGGTLAERDIRVVPFADIAGRITRVFTGRVN